MYIIFSFTNISEDLHMYLKKGKNKNIVIHDDLVLRYVYVRICINNFYTKKTSNK